MCPQGALGALVGAHPVAATLGPLALLDLRGCVKYSLLRVVVLPSEAKVVSIFTRKIGGSSHPDFHDRICAAVQCFGGLQMLTTVQCFGYCKFVNVGGTGT